MMVETEEILYLPHSMQLVEVVEEDITKDHTVKMEVQEVVHLFGMVILDLELLAKAMNASGQEIGRAKQTLALAKDDAKLISFSFDSKVDLDKVTKFLIDFRRK